MTTVLYNFIISPLEYIIENLFSLLFYVFEFNIGFAIIAISFIVSLLCLPFYCRADKIRKEEEKARDTIENALNEKYVKNNIIYNN